MTAAAAPVATSSAPNGAPSAPAQAPRGAPSPADPLARLEAAGIEDSSDEPYEDLSEIGIESPGEGDEQAEEQTEGEDEQPETDEEPAEVVPKGKGTREQPLKHKELPADKFVELKTADGKRVVVSLKDAVAGVFMSKDMVDRHVSTAKETMVRAEQIAETAVQHQKNANDYLNGLLADPMKLVKRLVMQSGGSVLREDSVLHRVAYAYAKMRKEPALLEDLRAVIRREQLDARERETQQRRQALEQQETETRELNQLQQELAPAYHLGLKDAGLLQLAKQGLPEELKDEIRMRYDYVRTRNGGKITPEQMRACVVAGAKAAGYPKGNGQRPAPAPKGETREERPRSGNGKRDWSQVPREVRMRDVDYLFRRR